MKLPLALAVVEIDLPGHCRNCATGGRSPPGLLSSEAINGSPVVHRTAERVDGDGELRQIRAMDDLIRTFGQKCPADRLVSFRELRELGLEERQIAAALRRKLLLRLRRGVYVSREFWQAQKAWDQHLLMIKAHHAASAGKLVYSHLSAARLWGMHVWDAPKTIHVIQPARRGEPSDDKTVVRHKGFVPKEQVATLKNIRVTSRERTILDCARISRLELAVVIADSGLHRGASLSELHELVDKARKSRHITHVRRVLEAVNGRSESAGETRLRLRLNAWGFPTPVLQHEIPTAEGTYRADFAWPGLKLIIEFDGDGKYFDYRSTDKMLLEERKRETRLMEDGWVIVRVRWAHLDDDAALKARLVKKYNEAFHKAAGKAV